MRWHSPDDDCPQIAVTWYEAAQYCNWLSQQEGIPQSEWVYPANLNDIRSGMTLPSNYLQRTGLSFVDRSGVGLYDSSFY